MNPPRLVLASESPRRRELLQEAGYSFFVVPFIAPEPPPGRSETAEAYAMKLARIKAEGVRQKLCGFTLDRPVPVHGGEAILRAGEVLGVTTSGNYGHSVGRSIVFGYLPIEAAGFEDYEIEVFCERVPARRHDRPLYDPDRARILA